MSFTEESKSCSSDTEKDKGVNQMQLIIIMTDHICGINVESMTKESITYLTDHEHYLGINNSTVDYKYG